MGVKFEFSTATRIIFGVGQVIEAGKLAATLGRNCLVISGLPEGKLLGQFTGILRQAEINPVFFEVVGEPTLTMVRQALTKATTNSCDFVISIGGGSAIDTGKAVASLMTNPGDPLDYLEVVGKGMPLNIRPLPFMAIPTTSGTGSEVTRNAVLEVEEKGVKVSLRSQMMLPQIALVDPELTVSLPPEVTASTGMDALTQLIEPFVSNQANPMTDGICREGIHLVVKNLKKAYQDGHNLEAREGMSTASLFGGLALANARLGAVHGFAGPLGGKLHAPHGAICACLLPYVTAKNVEALKERMPESQALNRYTEISRILTGQPGASIDDGIQWLKQLCQELCIPNLNNLGLLREDFIEIAENASRASSIRGNPIVLTKEELIEILGEAY